MNEREILYSVLFDMKRDITELKKVIAEILNNETASISQHDNTSHVVTPYNEPKNLPSSVNTAVFEEPAHKIEAEEVVFQDVDDVNDSLSLEKREIDLIKKALEKHHGKRRLAAEELGISERTLYRKIKEYNLD